MRLLLLPLTLSVIICGCADDSKEQLDWAKHVAEASQQQAQNTQHHVKQAQEQAIQAQMQVDQAHQEVKHVQRLRDIDKLTHDSRVNEATAQSSTWRAVLVGFSIVLAVLLLWLAREIRMRRILSMILLACKKKLEVQRE